MEFRRDLYWCDPRWGCDPATGGTWECCANEPYDNQGHGTHTMGTIVGDMKYGFGVAPGAKWIAAKGCRDGSCLDHGIATSAQWVMCPTRVSDRNQNSPDCSKGADVVNNSWGCGSGSTFFRPYVNAWIDAGIIPVFSNGNAGPICGTAGAPGEFVDVMGVGAVDVTGELASFSSRGPGVGSVLKPDFVAPGKSVNSTTSRIGARENPDRFAVNSGTSMAAPHVAGVAALMLSVNPSLDYASMYAIMSETTMVELPPPDNSCSGAFCREGDDVCGGVAFDAYPSFHYGFGEIDAFKAVVASEESAAKRA